MTYKTVITHPPGIATWAIENSHLVAVPNKITTRGISGLMWLVQEYADTAPVRPGRPPIGPITFRFEVDSDLVINLVHTHFTNKSGKLLRFMRLRLNQDQATRCTCGSLFDAACPRHGKQAR